MIMVIQIPPGSFPGIRNFATAPTTKPMMSVQSKLNIVVLLKNLTAALANSEMNCWRRDQCLKSSKSESTSPLADCVAMATSARNYCEDGLFCIFAAASLAACFGIGRRFLCLLLGGFDGLVSGYFGLCGRVGGSFLRLLLGVFYPFAAASLAVCCALSLAF
jgi:hypothetical protein